MVTVEVSVRNAGRGTEFDRTPMRAYTTTNERRIVSGAPVRSARIAEACEGYAARVRYRCVTLRDLCAVAGVSERRVRHAFYDCYGTSPTAHLRAAALHEVRHALLKDSPVRDPVTRAASDFGFRHLSRFASQYRALFGESPSETLARRRTRPHDAMPAVRPQRNVVR